MNKENNFKEKFKQALISTIKVISEDYKPSNKKNNESSKNVNFFLIQFQYYIHPKLLLLLI